MTDTSVNLWLKLFLEWEDEEHTFLKSTATLATTDLTTYDVVGGLLYLPKMIVPEGLVGGVKSESSRLMMFLGLPETVRGILEETYLRFTQSSAEKELTTWVIHSNGLIEVGREYKRY